MPFFKYLKNHTYESKNTWDNFFAHTLFQLFKKASQKDQGHSFCSYPFWNIFKKFLQIWNIPGTISLLISFFKYLKKHTYESENPYDNFFAQPLYKYLKKRTYESETRGNNFFAYTLFQIFKKGYLLIWGWLADVYCYYYFFNYLKKHTYESEQYLEQYFRSYPFSNI